MFFHKIGLCFQVIHVGQLQNRLFCFGNLFLKILPASEKNRASSVAITSISINPDSLDNKGSCWILKDFYCSVTMLRELKS